MATVQNLMDRLEGMLNDTSNVFFTANDANVLGWIVDGLQAVHQRMKSRLQGPPPAMSPYWRNFVKNPPATLTVSSGASEVALPADFDIMISLVDSDTEEELDLYPLGREATYRGRGMLGISGGQGYYAYSGGGNIKVLVWPGAEGTPQNDRDLICNYYQQYPRHTLVGDTVLVPDEFTEAAILYGLAKGLFKERESPVEALQAFEAAMGAIR